MANKQLFHDMLKMRRKAMGAGNRSRTKHPNIKQQWIYPHQWERKYAKDISNIQKLFTVPLTEAIGNNIDRWIAEYNIYNDQSIQGHMDRITDDSDTKQDDFGEELQLLIAAEQARLNQVYGTNAPRVRAMITNIGNNVSSWNWKQSQKFMKQLLGVEWIVTEPWETEVIQVWSETNFELIKSLSTEYIKTVNTLVSEGVQFGKTATSIMREIRKLDKSITGYRARLIARDQVGKLNGALTKRRMADAGIDMYTWQTAMDERVRSKHKTLNGMICRWDDNTVYSTDGITWKKRTSNMFIGIPGQDIQCRCTAIPYFDDMLQEIDKEIKEET